MPALPGKMYGQMLHLSQIICHYIVHLAERERERERERDGQRERERER